MTSIPIVSIIIVNFNSGDFLRQCLMSLKGQTFKQFEVIIVDNASSDDSLYDLPMADELRIFFNDHNAGFAVGQNQGMKNALGQFIMSLNYDIVLTHNFLEEMVNAMEISNNIGAISGKLLRMKPDGERTRQIDNVGLFLPRNRYPVHRGLDELDQGQFDQLAYVFGTMGAAALYRREMLEDVAYRGQYFDESYFMWYEDIDLDWRSRLRGWDCLYTYKAVAYHVGDTHGRGRSQFGAEISICNRWKMILANERLTSFIFNSPWLIGEEVALLIYMVRRGWFGGYCRAWLSFFDSLSETIKKRIFVQMNAKHKDLPDCPVYI